MVGQASVGGMPSVSALPSASPSVSAALGDTGGVKGGWRNVDAGISGRPRARHEACFVMVRGKGYLIGGRGMRGMDVYDPVKREWSRGPDPPTQMHHMQCVQAKGKIYIATSWYGPSPREQVNARMYVYDTKRGRWSSRKGLPRGRRRGGAGSVVWNGRIYVVCGNVGGHGEGSLTTGWLDYYDLEKRVWVTGLPDMPDARDHVGAAVVNGRLCVAGGRDGSAKSFFGATKSATYCYDFDAETWTDTGADIPTQRAGAAYASLCGGGMMVAGGESRFIAARREVEVFDGVKWTSVGMLERGRHGTGLAVSRCRCGVVFIASGSGARGGSPELDSTEMYVPVGGKDTCGRY